MSNITSYSLLLTPYFFGTNLAPIYITDTYENFDRKKI